MKPKSDPPHGAAADRGELPDSDPESGAAEAEPLALPIDGTLDLHTFSPRELGELIPDYLTECLQRGITELRIIHGKGQGVLRRTVHALLQRDPRVLTFQLADESGGGWGATLVRLRPR